MHCAFVRSPIVCLDHVSQRWPQDGVLRVEVVRDSKAPVKDQRSLERSYLKELAIRHNLGTSHFSMSEVERIMNADKQDKDHDYTFSLGQIFSAVTGKMREESSEAKKDSTFSIPKDLLGISQRSILLSHIEGNLTEVSELRMALQEFERYRRGVWPSEEAIVEYSLDYGMLRLAPATRSKLNVPVYHVTLNSDSDACFGDSVSRFVLRYLLGYGDILMSSLKRLAEREDNKGFVKNVVTGEHFRFVTMWTTRTSYITAALVMIIFTLSISMLMRYTHHQIFTLIVEILHLLEFNSGRSFRTTPLFTVVLALVGMEATMSEFFNDYTTAFGIIFVVWLADHFYAVCCHSSISKRHWPRFFFLYHFAFYAYDYRFNGQYSGLALLTSIFFILHSMAYFYHRFELPAIIRSYEGDGTATESRLSSHERMPTQAVSVNANGSSQAPAQFVISARVTVTRRVDASADSEEPSRLSAAVENEPAADMMPDANSDVSQNNRRSDQQRQVSTDTQQNPENDISNNRTRKLSCSSAEASSCGCCSSNETSDQE
ncbi:membralin-like isoform X2 [Varroa jacobsoni]|nr:membralin-like isoform X2 [Varroa jacobsoni]